MRHVFRSVDAHVGGAPVRVIVEGVPRAALRAGEHTRQAMKRHGDLLRRALMLEPRGHVDLCGVWLTEPASPGAHAGMLYVDQAGFPAFSGAATIGALTVAVERRLIDADDAERLTIDTPIGTVHARLRLQVNAAARRVDGVALATVPAFVASPGLLVPLDGRQLRVDLAFGGLFHAIVDTEAIGVPLDARTLPELRRLAVRICEAINSSSAPVHPAHGAATIAGVVFTGPPRDPEAHLRNITISASGAVDRSASVTGTAAVMAVLDAMQLLTDDQPFVHEGLIGTLHRGRVLRRTQVGETVAIVPEIEATAWITGEHTFYADDDDPLRDGYPLAGS
jgi:trans-L-3-hydroxyproline dehydratase